MEPMTLDESTSILEMARTFSRLTGKHVVYNEPTGNYAIDGKPLLITHDAQGTTYKLKSPDGTTVSFEFDPLSGKYVPNK